MGPEQFQQPRYKTPDYTKVTDDQVRRFAQSAPTIRLFQAEETIKQHMQNNEENINMCKAYMHAWRGGHYYRTWEQNYLRALDNHMRIYRCFVVVYKEMCKRAEIPFDPDGELQRFSERT